MPLPTSYFVPVPRALRRSMLSVSAVLACLTTWSASAHEEGFHEHGAHVHGRVYMTIAAADHELLIDWQVPAGDIFGFEHAPESDAQRKTIESELTWLRAASWVQFAGRYDCELLQAEAGTDLLDSSHHGHGDVEVSFHWQCAEPVRLSGMSLHLFDRYPALESVHFDWLEQDAAGSATLQAPQQQLRR